MHAQMFLVIEVGHNRIWQGAEADLNGVAVLNQAGYIIANPLRLFCGDRTLDFQ